MQRPIRYVILGVLCVVAAGGTLYLLDRPDTAAPAAALPEPAARRTEAVRPPVDADEPDVPSTAQNEQALSLIGEARRLADDGKFAEAQAVLDKADQVARGLREIADARRRIAELSTPRGQLATQLGRARSAIEQDDAAAAEKALAEAERLDPQAPEIATLRQALQAAQQKEARRHSRIAELLADMRSAIARRDFAGADGALNEALRIDVTDPLIDQARTELARAHDADRKKEQER